MSRGAERTRIVACFSEGTPYERMAQELHRSAMAHGVPVILSGFEDRGGWYENTAQKAREILLFRRALDGPLLYVDVDAEIRGDVRGYFDRLQQKGWDWGAHFFAGPAKGHDRTDLCGCLRGGPCTRPHRLLSGTLFLGDTTPCLDLLNRWVEENERRRRRGHRDGGGQKNLWRTFDRFRRQLRTAELPGRYCFVFDKPWAYPEEEPRLIVHHIASRQHRPREAP